MTALGRMTAATMGPAFIPMLRQRLTREYARHAAATMSADVYCLLVAFCAYHYRDDHQVACLSCRIVQGILQSAGEVISPLPVCMVTQLGFGVRWPTHDVQRVNCKHRLGDVCS